MARIIDAQSSGNDTSGTDNHIVLHADAEGGVTLPQGMAIGSLELNRDGQDLVLTSPDGRVLVVDDYFMGTTPPHITSADGAQLSPQLVQSFLTGAGDVRVAANEQMNDASPVGEVAEVSGAATVIHADGTRETIVLGTDINQGDIIETAENGAVNIKFSDDSSFAISQNARLAIDEYSFNAADQSGSTSLSLLRGVFMFTSGLIGRENPDQVHIETPVGSIGIRGTIIGGHIAEAGGKSQISVIEGAIVVRNGTGEQILSSQFETVQLNSFRGEIKHVGILDTVAVTKSYGAVRSVTPTLFSSIDDTARDNAPKKEATPQNAEPKVNADTDRPAPEERPQSQNETPRDPMMMQTLSMDKISKAELHAEIREMRTNMAENKMLGLNAQNMIPKVGEWLQQQAEVRDMRVPSALQFASVAQVNENATSGTAGRVIQVNPQANISYSFAAGGDAGGLFVIDPQSGLITVNGTVGDYEAALRAYNVTVRATNTDNGRFTDTTLSIGVNNVNEAPLSIALDGAPAALNENIATKTIIQNLTITDDATDNSAYSFKVYSYDASSNARGPEISGFTVEPNDMGGYRLVKTAGTALDFETQPSYSVVVGITEFGFGEVFSNPIALTVIDNPAPVLVHGTTAISINEGASLTLTSGDLEFSDSGTANNSIIYTVSKSSIAYGSLSGAGVIDHTDYVTFSQNDINQNRVSFNHDGSEHNASFSYTVSDGNEVTNSMVFNFTKQNVNDAPTKLITNGVEADLNTTVDASGGRPTYVVISKTDLGYSDSDGEVFYHITTLPSEGQLKLYNGTTWDTVNSNTNIYQSDINNNKLAYFPVPNSTETNFSFAFSVFDTTFTGQALVSGNHTINLVGYTPYATDFNLNDNAGTNVAAGNKYGAYLGILNDNSASEVYNIGHYQINSVTNELGQSINSNNFQIVAMSDGRIALKAIDSYKTPVGGKLTFDIGFNANKDITPNDIRNNIDVNLRAHTITLEDLRKPESSFGFVIKGSANTYKTGTAVAMADVDNDGKFDILTGTPNASSNSGMLSVHKGGVNPNANDAYLTTTSESDLYKNVVNGGSNAKYGSQIAILGHFDTSYSDGRDNGNTVQGYLAPGTKFDGAGERRNYVDIATAAPGNGEIRIDSFFVNTANYFQLRDSYTIRNVPTNASNKDSIMLAGIGDVNGDGFDDLLIGAQYDSSGYGTAKIIYGSATLNSSGHGNQTVEWSAIPTANTFNTLSLTGRNDTNSSGASVAGLADINRDGYSDFAISSLRGSGDGHNQGMVNIFFGRSTASTAIGSSDDAIIRGIDSGIGFGNKVASASDINSNGNDDLLIQDLGQHAVWLVDGSRIAKGVDQHISDIANRTEIRWSNGVDSNYVIGQAMTQAGNFNGDEYDDYVVSASRSLGDGTYEHTLFVIYGKETAPAQIYLSDMLNDSSQAYKIKLAESSGLDITATGGGDVNGDGYDDIVIGTPSAFGGNGASVVVYGNNSSGAVTLTSLQNLSGIGSAYRVTADNQSLVGTSSDDIFYNVKDSAGEYDGYYNGSIMGGAGNDKYIVETEDFLADGTSNYMFKKFDGGSGIDTLKLIHDSSVGQYDTDVLDLTGISDHMFNVERIELLKSSLEYDTVTISLKDVLTLISDSDKITDTGFKRFDIVLDGTAALDPLGKSPKLEINGFTGDLVSNPQEAHIISGANDAGVNYKTYTFSVGELWVQNTVNNAIATSTAGLSYTDY